MGQATGTIIGGAAGFALGGPAGAALGASLGGSLVDAPAANARAAEAAGGAARAQLEMEMQMRREARAAAEPSAMEIQQLEQAVNLQAQDVQRRQRLLDSSDPALIEAGKQALGLLQGQEAKVLDPIRRQREKEKLKLQDTLAQRLGTGWETSSAGIQAMSQFDEATNNVLAQAQDQSLARLLGVSQDTSARYGLDQAAKNAVGIAQARGNINSRMVNALTGNRVDNASAPFVSEMIKARGQGQQINSLAGMGMQLLGSGALGGFKSPFASTPTQSAWGTPTTGGSYNDVSGYV